MKGIDPSSIGLSRLPRALLLDTNVMLLLVVGLTDPRAVARVRPTRGRFEEMDVDRLIRALSKFGELRVTPNVLTETSDLLESRLSEPLRSSCLGTLKGILEEIETEERYVPSEKASRLGPYLRVGLADAATIEACRDECLVMTDDLDLFLVLQEENVAVVNFNHLRVA